MGAFTGGGAQGGSKVAGQFAKLVKHAGVVAQDSLELVAGHGIAGDVNADPRSPRQVLLLCESERQALGVEPGALRENLLLEGVDPSSLSSGSVVHVGGAMVRVTFDCEPCGFAVGVTGESLRSLDGRRGHLGVVVQSGTVHVDDPVVVTAGGYVPLPEDRDERVEAFVDAIPEGAWLTFADIVSAVGATKSCVRAVPRWLDRLPRAVPAHRVLPASGQPRTELARRRLDSEGVLDGGAASASCRWRYEQVFYQHVHEPL